MSGTLFHRRLVTLTLCLGCALTIGAVQAQTPPQPVDPTPPVDTQPPLPTPPEQGQPPMPPTPPTPPSPPSPPEQAVPLAPPPPAQRLPEPAVAPPISEDPSQMQRLDPRQETDRARADQKFQQEQGRCMGLPANAQQQCLQQAQRDRDAARRRAPDPVRGD